MKSIILILAISFFSVSCASPYIGRSVNTNFEGVCNFSEFPASCSSSDKNLNIVYQIKRTGKVGEYQLTGTAENVMGGNFSHYQDQGLNLDLLIVHNKTVVGSFGFIGNNIGTKTSFALTFFTPYDFTASLIDYSFYYK